FIREGNLGDQGAAGMNEQHSLERYEAADFINRTHKPIPRSYGDALLAAAKKDKRIVALTADLSTPTETDIFRDELSDRYHNVGIAEANMIGIASGMARTGEIPFVHTFCAFATKRCYDQITMQAAYPNLPIKIVGFLPGVATLLGVSHQAIEDVAIMRAIPNMLVIDPSGPEYHAAAVQVALDHEGPAYIRLKRPEAPPEHEILAKSFEKGKGIVARQGSDLTIIAAGLSVDHALNAANELSNEGIEAAIIDMPSIKPIDEKLIVEQARKTGAVVTAENHSIIGGLGSAVAEVLCDAGIGIPFKRVGMTDRFAEGGSTAYLFSKYGLDGVAISSAVRDVMSRK
ncbi:MAG: transketolase C-terminal domain-containing protein, partial [Pseudomonadota bacterium]